jgi:hypothetical protein
MLAAPAGDSVLEAALAVQAHMLKELAGRPPAAPSVANKPDTDSAVLRCAAPLWLS